MLADVSRRRMSEHDYKLKRPRLYLPLSVLTYGAIVVGGIAILFAFKGLPDMSQAQAFTALGALGVMLAGMAGVVALQYYSKNALKTVVPPLESSDELATPVDSQINALSQESADLPPLVFTFPELLGELRQAITGMIVLGSVMVVFGLIVVAGVSYFGVQDNMKFMTTPTGKVLLFMLIGGVGIVGAAVKIRRHRRELELSGNEPGGTDFILNAQGVDCCIGLIVGERRDSMRQRGQAVFHAPWEEIESWSVASAVASQNSRVPPRYRLCLRRGEDLVIMRQHFRGRESELLDAVRQRLHAPIELRDDLLE